MVKVQEEIQNPQNTATNPFFKSKYAPLPEILKMIRPLLSKNGIVLVQNTGTWPDGSPYVQTSLYHESGESIDSDKLTLKPDKSTPQGIGSAIAYGRRYQLTALLGIVGDADDDGNGAEKSGDEPKKTRKSRGPRPQKEPQTDDEKPKTRPKREKRTKKDNPPRELSDDEIKHLKKGDEWIKKAIRILQEDNVEISKLAILKTLDNMLGDNGLVDFDLDAFKEAKKILRVK